MLWGLARGVLDTRKVPGCAAEAQGGGEPAAAHLQVHHAHARGHRSRAHALWPLLGRPPAALRASAAANLRRPYGRVGLLRVRLQAQLLPGGRERGPLAPALLRGISRRRGLCRRARRRGRGVIAAALCSVRFWAACAAAAALAVLAGACVVPRGIAARRGSGGLPQRQRRVERGAVRGRAGRRHRPAVHLQVGRPRRRGQAQALVRERAAQPLPLRLALRAARAPLVCPPPAPAAGARLARPPGAGACTVSSPRLAGI